jgi:outer membrane protein OmpA-like peptidoglycan-associated protein
MRKLFLAIPIAIFAIGGSTACATKKFVRTSVGEVNDKVDSLGRSLEETQERTRQNEAKISDVDKATQAAAQAAKNADDKAVAANSAASAAANTANGAVAKADEVDKASKKLVFEVVLNEDQGNFKFGKTDLPDEAKARLDEMINQIKADPKGAFFEIEGHTDDVGAKEVNERLGMERAEAVKMISYGEEKPVAPNKTKAGRAQNRRVVIKVLV